MEAWERELFRDMFLLPKDLKRSAVVNLVRHRRPAVEVIRERAMRAGLAADDQLQLPPEWQKENDLNQRRKKVKRDNNNVGGNADLNLTQMNPNKRKRIYVPKLLAESVWGACRGKLTHHHGETVTCQRHGCEADLLHARECDLFIQGNIPMIEDIAAKIKVLPFNEWETEEQNLTILAFAALQLQVFKLKNEGNLIFNQMVKQRINQETKATSPEKKAPTKSKLRRDQRQAIADFKPEDTNMATEFEAVLAEDTDANMVVVGEGGNSQVR